MAPSRPKQPKRQADVSRPPLRTLQQRLRRGSSIRAAEFTRGELQAKVQALNLRFGLSIPATDELYDELRRGLRIVSGAVEDTLPITRKDLESRLDRLREAVATAATSLEPSRLGICEEADSEFIFFLAEVVGRAQGAAHDGLSLLNTHLRLLEALKDHCDRAAAMLAELPAKTGRRSLEFYKEYMLLVVPIAQRLGMKISTAGSTRGSDEAYATPFTVFVHSLESFLPRGAWSNSLAACAKRIDRALKDLAPPRQN